MAHIIIICDTAEWFKLVLLLCMHFCLILYILLMGTKICIKKCTFSQIAQILVVFSSGSNCSFSDFMSFQFQQFLAFLFKTNQFNHLHHYYYSQSFLVTLVWPLPHSFDPVITLQFTPSILLLTFPPFHVCWCSCIFFLAVSPFLSLLFSILDHFFLATYCFFHLLFEFFSYFHLIILCSFYL